MTNKSIDKPLYRYAEINRQMTGNSTLDCNYTAQIEFLNESSWDSSAVAGGGIITFGLHYSIVFVSGK